ncbi:MAG: S8 family serine peptidase [Pseudomonadota bacterium]|nr:S8 family serine peptidase [Pseudomonadota bacterium]
MLTKSWIIVMVAAMTLPARAQLRLPAVPLPTLPSQLSPLQSGLQTLDQADARTLERLRGARRLAISRLIRGNGRVVEADPDGEPTVRGEILALSPSAAALSQAVSSGFLVAREQTIAAVGLHLVVLVAPPGMSTQRALAELRKSDANGLYDYNHIYTSAGVVAPDAAGSPSAPTPGSAAVRPAAPFTGFAAVPAAAPFTRLAAAPPAVPTAASAMPPAVPTTESAAAFTASIAGPTGASAPQTAPSPAVERAHVRVGLLDAGIDTSHPIFQGSTLHTWGCAGKPSPSPHGTAVASLLLSHASAELYAADVYCGLPTGGAVDAIIAAFAWLVSEPVAVINVSLVGPKNAMLEHTVAALVAHGYLIVAAVGNDGPTAPPLYPAAYPQVVGVTGVDASRRVLLEALRGPQVMFAAGGAGIKAATVEHGFADVRGTSFAAPAVAELLAEAVTAPDKPTADAAVDALAKQAIDLGPPGRDFTYGFGLVGPTPAR